MAKFQHKKFSLIEMTSNQDGKTSASGTMGSALIAIGGFTFLCGALGFLILGFSVEDLLVQSIALCYAGAMLLGYRKGQEGTTPPEVVDPPTPEDPKE